jgi:hypothetical protein
LSMVRRETSLIARFSVVKRRWNKTDIPGA